MCGRYIRDLLSKDAIKHFDLVDGIDYFDIHGYKVSPEVFPGEWIFAINNAKRPEDIWWTIEDRDAGGTPRRTINAKSETITKVQMFKDAFRNDRVLIPATGFFEWATDRQKYLFTFDEPVFAFGGVARDCEIKGEIRRCGVILTTEANDVVRPIHVKNRMPVVIHKYDYAKWLDPETGLDDLRRMMMPLPSAETHVQPVDDTLAQKPARAATEKGPASGQASLFDL